MSRSQVVGYCVILLLILQSTHLACAQEEDKNPIKGTTEKIAGTVDNWADFLLNRDQDTNYIKNMSDRWAVNLLAINKFNYFRLFDHQNNSSILYRPELGLNLGLGVSYKWFALSLTFNAFTENKELIEGETFDFQAKVFSSKQLISFAVQNYYGYAINRSSGLSAELSDIEKQRNDIRTLNVSLHWTYAFNYEKYSMKAPFVFNERQERSAGSVISGISFNYFVMDGDSIIIPETVKADFDPQIYLTDLNIMNLILRVGYSYTFSIKKYFFITLGLIPGMAVNRGDYRTEYRNLMGTNISWAVNTSNSIGYNGDNFFGGIQASADVYNVRTSKKMRTNVGQGSFKFVFGYRFKARKSTNSRQ